MNHEITAAFLPASDRWHPSRVSQTNKGISWLMNNSFMFVLARLGHYFEVIINETYRN